MLHSGLTQRNKPTSYKTGQWPTYTTQHRNRATYKW